MLFPNTDDEPAILAEINTTPLIDVLLVLLVMLIITIPLQTHSVGLELPSAPPSVAEPPPSILIEVDAAGLIQWGGHVVPDAAALETLFQSAVDQPSPLEIHLKASNDAPYDRVAAILATAQRTGARKFGFVE